MSGNPQVVIFGRAGAEPRDLMQKLAEAGFACIFQGIDSKVEDRFGLKLGGSATAAAVVLDLGAKSIETASAMLESSPGLKGKILILAEGGAQPSGGLILTDSSRLIDDLKRLI